MTAVVVIGGVPSDQVLPPRAELGAVRTVIAADSGWDLAVELGFDVDLLIGDLDSISPQGLVAAERSSTRIEPHPADKDATDLELALDAALRRAPGVSADDPERVVVIGGEGGRLDHIVANLVVMGSPRYRGMRLEGWLGGAYVAVVNRPMVAVATAGSDAHRGAVEWLERSRCERSPLAALGRDADRRHESRCQQRGDRRTGRDPGRRRSGARRHTRCEGVHMNRIDRRVVAAMVLIVATLAPACGSSHVVRHGVANGGAGDLFVVRARQEGEGEHRSADRRHGSRSASRVMPARRCRRRSSPPVGPRATSSSASTTRC